MNDSDVYIFISYSHSDSEFVSKFSDRLYEAGIPHFRDTKSIKWGESIPKRIHQELEKATHLVICISPGSEQSQWVAYEMGYAKGKKVTLVPYLLHPKMKVPGFIEDIKYLSTIDEETQFIKSISSKLSYVLAMDKEDDISSETLTGYINVTVDNNSLSELISNGDLPIYAINTGDIRNKSYAVITTNDTKADVLARVNTDLGKLVRVDNKSAFGIKANNIEHNIALDLLLDDSVKVVVLIGDTETEKRYLAIAAGIDKVADENIYKRLTITRCISMKQMQLPPFEFLPGDIEEKYYPLTTPIFDEIERVLSEQEDYKAKRIRGYKELVAMGIMEIEMFGALIGRRFSNQYILVDDAQNMTIENVKNMIKSTMNNAKLIFLCDFNNIVNDKVNKNNGGVNYLLRKLSKNEAFGCMTLTDPTTDSLSRTFDRLI